MHMHTNIEHAIVAVKERGHELTVPNVLAAYIQHIAVHIPPEDATDDGKMAQAAITSFERAMDKYPAPSPQPFRVSAKAGALAKTADEVGHDMKRMFCAEVAQLRGEYLQASWRTDQGYSGCRCLSCGSLLKMHSSQVRKLDDGEGEANASIARPVRKRRAGKPTTKKTRAAKKLIFDPYAPSTSTAAI
ncbi:hypothetical protein BC628DRAFT_1325330 [Trametes gibbosa]|nr:hypothetical protein BC628DRAFT_1325330 [Trametes gibbosa]